mmetsp:Transcript_8982/g.31486  ORF Transcript_8982/g.31486 Transcript_8982/m.31486 type:complete len:250 (-) Transcript_8982:422-1171(-)
MGAPHGRAHGGGGRGAPRDDEAVRLRRRAGRAAGLRAGALRVGSRPPKKAARRRHHDRRAPYSRSAPYDRRAPDPTRLRTAKRAGRRRVAAQEVRVGAAPPQSVTSLQRAAQIQRSRRRSVWRNRRFRDRKLLKSENRLHSKLATSSERPSPTLATSPISGPRSELVRGTVLAAGRPHGRQRAQSRKHSSRYGFPAAPLRVRGDGAARRALLRARAAARETRCAARGSRPGDRGADEKMGSRGRPLRDL